MSNPSSRTLSALLLTALLAPACDVDDAPAAAPALAQGHVLTDSLNPARGSTLRGELELLRDGATQLGADPELSALVRDLAQAHHDAQADFEVPLAELRDAAADIGLDLDARLSAGVLARGGSDGDAAHAVALLGGIKSGGELLTPTLFVPFMDADQFDQGDWDGHTPAGFSTELSAEGYTMHVVNADGTEELVGEDALAVRATWFVSVHHGDAGPNPARLWARCWCVQTNPGPNGEVGAACMTHGSTTTQGRCGRTGLFSDACSGADLCGG